jgi:hypothetical protein
MNVDNTQKLVEILEIRRSQRIKRTAVGCVVDGRFGFLSDPSYFLFFYVSSDLCNIPHCTVKFFQNLQLERAGFLLVII